MRNLVQEAIQTFGDKRADPTGTTEKKGGFARTALVDWKMCKHLLFFGLLFGCHLLVHCDPKTMTKVTEKPGYYSSTKVTYDGPSTGPVDPSIFQRMEKDANSRVGPGQQPFGFEALTKWLSNKQQMPEKQSSRFGSPQKQGSQRSGSRSSSFSDKKNWMKMAQKTFVTMRKSMLKGMNNCRQGLGEMSRKPTQGRLGENGARTRGRNDGWGGETSRSRPRSSNFHQENLDAHNEYRKRHGVPLLRLNNQLSKISQRWAEHLASLGSIDLMHHSDESFNKGYGENIHGSTDATETGRRSVDRWYAEINNYDFRKGTSKNGKMIGHFTQLIWKNSEELGVGYAFSSDGSIFVVCHYNPPGNYRGQQTWNVPPVGGF